MVRWRNSASSYGWISIGFHWVVAVLFLGEIPFGYLTQVTGDRPVLQFWLYQWHKSFGFAVLALAVLRILWWVFAATPEELPVKRAEALAARVMRPVLLALTIAVPLAGWCVASASPLRIPSLAFDLLLIPNLPLPVSDSWEAAFSSLHAWLAYAAGVLALLHIGAALRHHMLLHDRTLRRMLRPG